ncbi:MAG: hypothetical protein AB7K09_08745 [Planctomycetota bacterium]
MQKTAFPAATISALTLVAAVLAATVMGCKPRDPVEKPPPRNDNTATVGNPAMAKELREAKERIQLLEGQLKTAQDNAVDITKRIGVVEAELATANSQRGQLQDERAALIRERDGLQREVNDLKIKLAEAMRSGGSTPNVTPPTNLDPPGAGDRPELTEGWMRQDAQGGFGYDYPAEWTVKETYNIDSTTTTLTGPSGATMMITVWGFPKASDELVNQRYTAILRDMQEAGTTPTTEEEVMAVEAGLAGKAGHAAQIRYEKDGVTWRHRIAAASLTGASADGFPTMVSVLVEYKWDATNDAAGARYAELVSRFWVQ